jgi:hypothetical protein
MSKALFIALFALSVAYVCYARVTMEALSTAPHEYSSWVQGERVPPSLDLALTFALKLSNPDELQKTLMDVSGTISFIIS